MAALAAPTAQAAEVHVENGVIVFTAAPGEQNSVLVDRDPGFTDDQYQIEDQDNDVSAGSGCANKPHFPSGTEPNIVTCSPAGVGAIKVVLGNGALDSVRFGDLDGHVINDFVEGDGNDRVSASNGPSTVNGGLGNDEIDTRGGADQVHGGAGRDDIVGGPGGDTLLGEGDADHLRGYAQPGTLEIGEVPTYRGGDVNVLSGGPGGDTVEGDNGRDKITGGDGNDKLLGGGDADTLNGGAGNDRLDEGDTAGKPTGEKVGAPIKADVVIGGGGTDTAAYCTRRGDQPLSITLDGKANDGRSGEGDSIKADVENVLGGGTSDDTIKGNGKVNVLTGDCLNTEGSNGDNKIFGLGGNDRVVGGFGNDTLDGGSGRDVFVGNEGLDSIKAKDGTKDSSINCDGAGDPLDQSDADRARVDHSDPAAKNCEHVSF